MTLTRLKAKNQLTIPQEVVQRLHLKPQELFVVNVEKNYIKLTPVEIEAKYAPEELTAMDEMVEREKEKAKAFKPGKEFADYIKKITR